MQLAVLFCNMLNIHRIITSGILAIILIITISPLAKAAPPGAINHPQPPPEALQAIDAVYQSAKKAQAATTMHRHNSTPDVIHAVIKPTPSTAQPQSPVAIAAVQQTITPVTIAAKSTLPPAPISSPVVVAISTPPPLPVAADIQQIAIPVIIAEPTPNANTSVDAGNVTVTTIEPTQPVNISQDTGVDSNYIMSVGAGAVAGAAGVLAFNLATGGSMLTPALASLGGAGAHLAVTGGGGYAIAAGMYALLGAITGGAMGDFLYRTMQDDTVSSTPQ